MKNTLQYYYEVQRDINLDSFPLRLQDGTYKPSHGQLKILNDSKYIRFREIAVEIKQFKERKRQILHNILVYQTPTDRLEQEAQEELKNLKIKLNRIELELSEVLSEKNKLIRDLTNRGFFPKTNNPELQTIKQDKRDTKGNFKKILGLVGIWLVLEVFMSLIQWSSLRAEKGIEDIIIRSLSLGVLLGFFHLISHKNQITKRLIYRIYQGFNICMIAIMMFAPPVLYHIYPIDNTGGNIASAWSLTEDNKMSMETQMSDTPSLVQLYRKNEWMPAGLSIVFFIVIYFGMQKSGKNGKKEGKILNDEQETELILEPAQERILFLSQEEERLNSEKGNIENSIKTIKEKPSDLIPLLKKVENMQEECRGFDKKIAELNTEFDLLLSNLILVLDEYKVEFLNVLKNDEIKSVFINPIWPNKSDLVNHFKILEL